jgi:hypothetical protein
MFKEPKIVQVVAGDAGIPSVVLYDDGRVFFQKFAMSEDRKTGWYEWAELTYPIARIPRPPQAPPRQGRARRKSK